MNAQTKFESLMIAQDRSVVKCKDGRYADGMVFLDFVFWNIAVAAGHKQALEEAISILDDNKTNSTGAHITLNALRGLLK